MKRATLACLALLLILGALPATADEPAKAPEEMVVMTYVIHVRPDSVLKFEEAVKNHMAMHAKAGDPSPSMMYMEVLGDNMGTYVLRSAPSHWADFDNEMKIPGDREDVLTNIVPLTTHTSSHVSKYLPKISNWPEDLQPKFVEVEAFTLKYGTAESFFHAVKKIDKAIKEKAPDRHYAWEHIMQGADGPEYIIAFPYDSWAAFAEPDPPLYKILDEVYGETDAKMIWKSIGDAIAEEHDLVFAFRPDLSYTPAKK